MTDFLKKQIQVYPPAFLASCKVLKPFFLNNWILLLVVFLVSEGLIQHFTQMKLSTRHAMSVNYIAFIGEAFTALFHVIFFTFLVAQKVSEISDGSPRENLARFALRHIWPYTLESIRALAKALLWSILFLIPGLFFYTRYFFVPFVVLKDPEYQLGQVDALKRSNDLIKGMTGTLFLLLVALLSLEILRQSLRELFLFSEPHVIYGVAFVFEFLFIFSNILLFQIYRLRIRGLSESRPEQLPQENAKD